MDSMAPMPNAISSEDEVVVDSKLTADTYTDNKNEYEKYEVVLVVPQKLTMIAKNIIYNKRDITPLNYHLEGRFGSRIHRVDESHMGLPLYTVSLSSSDDNESLKAKEEEEEGKAKLKLDNLIESKNNNEYDDVRGLLDMDGVSLICKLYVNPPSHRARPPPYIDSRIHPEREEVKEEEKQNTTNATTPNPTPKPSFTYAELFAGMGGFGIALDKLGGRCIFCSELEEHLRNVYHHNFVTIPNNNQNNNNNNEQNKQNQENHKEEQKKKKQKQNNNDINNNDCDNDNDNDNDDNNNDDDDGDIHIPMYGNIYEIPDSAFPDPSIELDLLVGGFPCQPFSALGQQPGLNCTKAGNLFLEIVRFLKVSKPKGFLLENVPGLLEMKDTYTIIVNALEDVGYDVSTEVCSARGLTATGRKRLFFVGLRKDRRQQQENHRKFEFPFVPDLQLTFHDVLEYDNLPQEELDILRLAESTFHQLSTTNKRRWRSSSLAWPNTKGDTLTSHYGNAVGRGESQLVPCCAPNLPRRFSIREMSRLMGFPNTYEFLPIRERQSQMAYRKENYRMIGNAVCPPLIAALAGAVLDHITICCCPNATDDSDHHDQHQHQHQHQHHIDWVQKGRKVAVELAIAATRSDGPAKVPRGCLVQFNSSSSSSS
jgi:DNA (cytosine-5)-methyltransferase 1